MSMSSSRDSGLPLTPSTKPDASRETSTSAPSDPKPEHWFDRFNRLADEALVKNVREGNQFPPGNLETPTKSRQE
jgi:hypothetical protein